MKVTLAKHGGLAAAMRRVPYTLDATNLPAAAARQLHELAEAALAAGSGQPQAGGAPDAMSYSITIADDRSAPVVLRCSDTDLSPAVAALIDWLDRQAAGTSRPTGRP